MDEVEVLAFRADTKASKGLTASHIAKAAELYDPETAPAPLVFGHPKNDSPALGHVSGARADGPNLFLKLKGVAEKVVQDVKERKILGRSIAFWDPRHPSNPNPGHFTIRHLGLLGGQAPAIPGMPALRFSADETELESDDGPSDAVIFALDEAPTPVQVITEEPPAPAPKKDEKMEITQEALDAETKAREAAEARVAELEKAEADRAAQFAADEATRRATETKTVLDGLVEGGKLAPAERGDFEKLFEALDTKAVTFSAVETGEVEPSKVLAKVLDRLPKIIPTDAKPKSPTEFSASTIDAAKDAEKAALEARNARTRDAHKAAA